MTKKGGHTDETSRTESTTAVVRIQQLARTFPGLAHAPGVDPWDPVVLDEWAVRQRGDRDWPTFEAAGFVLQVWDYPTLWRTKFDVVFAWYVWDADHRDAFLAWTRDPWWLGDERWQHGRRPVERGR